MSMVILVEMHQQGNDSGVSTIGRYRLSADYRCIPNHEVH